MSLNIIKYVAVAVTLGLTTSAFAGDVSWAFNNGGPTEDNYTAVVTRGQNNQVLGRVSIQPASATNAEMTGIAVSLIGARTGLSNLRIFTSTSPTFDGSALQFGTTNLSDPGAGSASFSGSVFRSSLFYIYLVADVSAAATGSVQANVTSFSTFTSVSFVTGFSNPEPMSNASTPLPVALTSFSAE